VHCGKRIDALGSVTRRSGFVAFLALALVELGGSALASPARPSPQNESQAVFKSGVEVVRVAVAVRDDRGRVVRHLKQADFEVFDAGVASVIQDFYVGDSPISLAVLLDISGSMAVGGNMDRARTAVSFATMNLGQKGDEAALYTFDSKLQEVVPFTEELTRIQRVTLEGKPWGVTSLYDAIGKTAESVAERQNRHRAILVVTDGVDTGSSLTPGQVSAIASSIDVPVYLLVVVNPLDHPGGPQSVTPSEERAADTVSLADLSRWTGGDMRIVSVPAQMSIAVRDLFDELRYQYLITFAPGTRPGWHPIEVRTPRKKGLVVHARSGYVSSPARNGRS
jgi:Ca-activated chloride channel family protein